MEVTKISPRNIYEEVAERIKRQIENGELRPGDKLPSARELSEFYHVGRSTVREALSALKAMGLVEIRHGEGSYVRGSADHPAELPGLSSVFMKKESLLELLEARKALEVSNAAIAAEKRTEEDMRRFESILHRMKDHLGNETEGEKADMEFHLALARATHNSIMVRLLETISSQMETAIRETRRLQMYANKSVSRQLWREHDEIYEAVKLQEPELAQEKMRHHLFHVENVLLKYLK